MKRHRKLRREIKELAIILPLAGSLLAISVFYNKNEPKSDFKKQNINSSIKTNNTEVSLCTTTFKDTTMTVKSKTSSVDTASVIVDTTSMTTDISTSNITAETSEVSDNITDIATTELNCEFEYTKNNYETETTCVYEMYESEVIYESEVVIEENYDIEYSECNGETTSDKYLTDYEYIMLCNAVAYEAGSDWIPTSEKAKVAEVIMNRVASPDFPDTIYDVLTQEGQFVGVWNYVTLTDYSYKATEDVKSAVNMALKSGYTNHGYLFFEGDGTQNYFK